MRTNVTQTGIALGGILAQGLEKDLSLSVVEHREVRHGLHVRAHVVRKAVAIEWIAAQAQLDIGQGQAVLIAQPADRAAPGFRRHVSGCAARSGVEDLLGALLAGQAKVGHLGMSLQEEDVFRFDVAVEHVAFVQIIEPLSSLAEVADQIGKVDAGLSLVQAFFEAVAQAAVCQFHGDVEAVVQHPVSLRLQQERVPQSFDQLQRFQLAAAFVFVDCPIDALDGYFHSARRFRPPERRRSCHSLCGLATGNRHRRAAYAHR